MMRDFKYGKEYSEIRAEGANEDPRPWDFTAVLKSNLPKEAVVLDCGCGTAFKDVELVPFVKKVVGFDSSEGILEKAKEVVQSAGKRQTIDLALANVDFNFPFPSGYFDMVANMLAPHNAKEEFRVLKPGGMVVMERPGEGDKRNAKLMFGSDDQGPRGYLCDIIEGGLANRYEEDFKKAGFAEVTVREGQWGTYYTRDGLIKVISGARTVRNFDVDKDAAVIDEIEREFTTPRGIRLVQHRILLTARKN